MRVHLAGLSLLKNNSELLKKCRFMLESFYSVKEWQIPYLTQAEGFLLDSGAFTFMQAGKTGINFDDYIEKYARFVNEYDIKHFFELDIESVVGWEEYKRLAQKLKQLTHKTPIPVFHNSRGREWFLNELDYCDYIAYGGIVGVKHTQEFINVSEYLINEAHKKNCMIHGLGFTSTTMFKQLHYDSVDSTTWTMGGRMGNLCYVAADGTMKQWYPSTHGKKPTDTSKINFYNFEQWCKFQDYAFTHY